MSIGSFKAKLKGALDFWSYTPHNYLSSMSNDIIPHQTNFTQLSWYKPLVESIHDTITVAVTESRTRLVEGYWSVGKLIRVASEGIKTTELLQQLAVDLKLSERTLWYALKAYDTYPDILQMPEGNNISWHKLVNKYLTDPSEKEIHEVLLECPNCKFKDLPEKFRKL